MSLVNQLKKKIASVRKKQSKSVVLKIDGEKFAKELRQIVEAELNYNNSDNPVSKEECEDHCKNSKTCAKPNEYGEHVVLNTAYRIHEELQDKGFDREGTEAVLAVVKVLNEIDGF